MKKQTLLKEFHRIILNKEDLLKLKGGTDTETTFACKSGTQLLGCITLGTCNLAEAEAFCGNVFPWYDTIVYSCGHTANCSY
jgi:hypothetical protein